jgi:hypothetical protein
MFFPCAGSVTAARRHKGGTQMSDIDTNGSHDIRQSQLEAKYRQFASYGDHLLRIIPNQQILERFGVFVYVGPQGDDTLQGRVFIPLRNSDTGEVEGYVLHHAHLRTQPAEHIIPSPLDVNCYLFGAFELSQELAKPIPGDTITQRKLTKLVLVESPLTCLRFLAFGVPSVATYGSPVSEHHAEILGRLAKGVVLMPDRGTRSTLPQTLEMLTRRGLWVAAPRLPSGCTRSGQLTRKQLYRLCRKL